MVGDLDDDTTSVDAEQGNGMPPPFLPSSTAIEVPNSGIPSLPAGSSSRDWFADLAPQSSHTSSHSSGQAPT